MLLSLLGQPNRAVDTDAMHGHTANILTDSPKGLGTSVTAEELSCTGAQTELLQKKLAGQSYLQIKSTFKHNKKGLHQCSVDMKRKST